MRVRRCLALLICVSAFTSLALYTRLARPDHELMEAELLVARLRPSVPAHVTNCSWLGRALREWASAEHVLPEHAPLGHVVACARALPLEWADLSSRGSQLKLELRLKGHVRALFKPKRYALGARVRGPYAGFDRHNGEVIGFHVARLLALPAPIVLAHALSLADVARVASPALKKAIQGACVHWRRERVCFGPKGLEGALVLELPFPLTRQRSPFARTYTEASARWQTDPRFCREWLAPRVSSDLLRELSEAAIFDFLVQNGDRHHLERFRLPRAALLLLDNGKSFGDPDARDLSILAPLTQCCHARPSTVRRMRQLARVGLAHALETQLRDDPWWPLATRAHLAALDARLKMALHAVDTCSPFITGSMDARGAAESRAPGRERR